MDLRKLQTTDSLIPAKGLENKGGVNKNSILDSGFADALGELQSGEESQGIVNSIVDNAILPSKDGFKDKMKFSNHAVERMRMRGISFNPQDIQRLNEAVDRAAAKGSKNSLILMNESALIVSVKNNTVVTVMDKNALKENVFTNIDSTIVM
ncbi:MAG: TIGR02530 family flagellar biosynthesis protein [Pseudobdellovibrionaceae bacterium]